MNGKQHFKGFYIFTAIIVTLIIAFWNWKFAIPLPLMFWVIFPDLDLGIDVKVGKSESHVHRLLYSHSLIYPFVVTFTITMIVDEALSKKKKDLGTMSTELYSFSPDHFTDVGL